MYIGSPLLSVITLELPHIYPFGQPFCLFSSALCLHVKEKVLNLKNTAIATMYLSWKYY